MSEMFFRCESLSSFPDISKWNTDNVSDMSDMFRRCKDSVLDNLNLDKFDYGDYSLIAG